MCPYNDFHELYQLALKAERRTANKSRSFNKPTDKQWTNKPWEKSANNQKSNPSKTVDAASSKTYKPKPKGPDNRKDHITCFKCN